MATRRPTSLSFRPGISLGSEAAEQDSLLASCFVRTSSFEIIRSFEDPRCILVGRSGIGKTAILRHLLDTHEDVLTIRPRALAFQFLRRSDLLRTLRESGVHLDLFYQSLWRHVLVIEILKHYLPDHLGSRGKVRQVFEAVMRREPRHARQLEEATAYLDGLSPSFFAETADRVQEIHTNLESNMRAALKLRGPWTEVLPIGAELSGDRKHIEAVTERRKIAQDVVNTTKIAQLDAITDFIDRVVVTDEMRKAYVLIDDLDSNWVDDDLVYDLVRALLLELFQFATNVKRVKILVSVRDNLLSKIESVPRVRGYYQREKLQSQRLRISWTTAELKDMVDRRVNEVLRSTYTGQTLTHRDILPARSGRFPAGIDFILARCYGRPRDVIYYLNLCLKLSQGRATISMTTIRKAEDEFSHWRFDCLEEEWRENYPGIANSAMRLLVDRAASFSLVDWTPDDMLDATVDYYQHDWAYEIANHLLAITEAGKQAARRRFAQLFYEVGMVGVRTGPGGSTRFAHEDVARIPDIELEGDVHLVVHPALRKHLRIRE